MISAEQFYEKTQPEPNSGCWLWRAGLTRYGYGAIGHRGGSILAHRASWAFSRGPIPEGMLVCHKCDVPACVNPDHLFLGTYADNAADRERKGRGRQPSGENHASRKHPFALPRGEAHWCAKLTSETVAAIRADARTQQKIASAYGISQSVVGGIKRREIWRHVQ